MYVATVRADRAVCNAVDEIDIEERCEWRVQLDSMLPELAMTANLAIERDVTDRYRSVLSLYAGRSFEESAQSKHGMPYVRANAQRRVLGSCTDTTRSG